MLIKYHGHSEFLLESADGCKILTDPYDAHVGYPMKNVQADVVTVSHGHGDHAYTQKVISCGMTVTETGTFRVSPTCTVTGCPSFHDENGGADRGKNIVYIFSIDGLRIAHLGDLGHIPDETLYASLSDIDILLIPVGGFYTIDAVKAAEIVRKVSPKVTIPMHYKTGVNEAWPIGNEKSFLKEMSAENAPELALMRVTKADISCFPAVLTLKID